MRLPFARAVATRACENLRVILRLVLSPLILLVRLLLAPLRALRRARAAPKGALVELRIKGKVREGPPRPRRWWPPRFLVRGAPRADLRVHVVRRVVDEVIADARVSGLLVTIDALEAGWSALEGLRGELARVRASGKRLVAWLPEGGSNRELYVASVASTVIAAPTSDIALVGSKAEGLYVKRVLDRLGIDVELHARKEFKSAGDRVAREGRSEADRLQTEILVDSVDRALFGAVAEGRGLSPDAVRAAVEQGPTHARVAVERGLLDHVAHDDDLPTLLAARIVPASSWFARRRAGRDLRPFFPRRVIGVVEVHGAITSARSPMAEAMGPVAMAERVIADLRAAERDPRVAAVVLDVDSPGGTVIASDAIGAAVRRLAQKKPVIARMGDVAASGGYWVACEAKAIVARPLTITGSIGVVAIRPVAARLLERLGVVRDVIARAPYADLDALARPPRDDERALFAREIDLHYDAFVEHVARARNRPKDVVEPLARGRVWTGSDAASQGLVDHLGGFELACELLRREIDVRRLDPDPRVVVGPLPTRRNPMPEPREGAAALVASLLPGDVAEALAPIVAAIEARTRFALL